MSETTLTSPSTITPLQSMLHENYALRELWTNAAFTGNVAYTGSVGKFAIDASNNFAWTGGTWTFNGGNVLISAGALSVSGGDISTSGVRNILVTGSGGAGYGTGSGGTVTQSTDKSTTVVLNKTNGLVTTHNAALASGAKVYFTITNSTIAATDAVVVSIGTGVAGNNLYRVWVGATGAGSIDIGLENVSVGSRSDAVPIRFAVIKASNS